MEIPSGVIVVLVLIGILVSIAILAIMINFGALWLQAQVSGVRIGFTSLIGMSLRQVKASDVVRALIMGKQAGLSMDGRVGMNAARLEAHVLAGGDILRVTQAIIVANRAGIDLDFDRAAAIDLAGRDVLDAVRISVSPKVIDCPQRTANSPRTISAVSKDGVELKVHARVTVRTNLNQLIGGATEETIVARVCQGIVSAIGSSLTYMDVLASPNRIAQAVLERGLDVSTAFEIVSIDIADVNVGENIGARLRVVQADADMRSAQAGAEGRRAAAIACQHENMAKITAGRAQVVMEESKIPLAISSAIGDGRIQTASKLDFHVEYGWEAFTRVDTRAVPAA